MRWARVRIETRCRYCIPDNIDRFLDKLMGTGIAGEEGSTEPQFFDLTFLDNSMPVLT